jgi:poly(3-hydroxybutyrate) depolymerase
MQAKLIYAPMRESEWNMGRVSFTMCAAVLLLFSLAMPQRATANIESRWGAQERYTRQGHWRYLLLFPPHYDPHRKYELWLSLHGDPGSAEQGIYFYYPEAQQRQVFLLAPQGTGDAAESYVRTDGSRGVYRFLDKRRDPARILAILDEVIAQYPIDRQRVALLGFSAGCAMGWRLLAARPEQFYFFGGIANGFRHGRTPVNAARLRRAAKHTAHFYAAGQDDGFAGPMFGPTARRLRQYGFELRTGFPAGVGHAIPPAIKVPLIDFMDEVRARGYR